MMRIGGFCPMGCGPTLILGFGERQPRLRRVLCSHPDCPEPAAVDRILADPETGHVVTLEPGGYSVKHPLRERLDDELLYCALAAHVAEFGPQYLDGGVFGAPIPPAVPHRVYWVGEGEDAAVEWERL